MPPQGIILKVRLCPTAVNQNDVFMIKYMDYEVVKETKGWMSVTRQMSKLMNLGC